MGTGTAIIRRATNLSFIFYSIILDSVVCRINIAHSKRKQVTFLFQLFYAFTLATHLYRDFFQFSSSFYFFFVLDISFSFQLFHI